MVLKNSVRIIGGQWRGRQIAFNPHASIRPTPDRVRETLFNWLMTRIKGAKCLDLFAGSGILALEALSRGALEVVCLDTDIRAIKGLKAAKALLKIPEPQLLIEQADTLKWLSRHQGTSTLSTGPFEVIFLDPPYEKDLWLECLRLIKAGNWLTEQGVIYMEADRPLREIIEEVGFSVLKEKQFGAVYAYMLRL